ncbi:hypothetical protein AgCh_009893 [Apium graveolens]
MVDAIVSFAIEKLDDFLTREVNTRIGVKDGVRWLKDELGYLQSSVRDADATQELDHRVRQWINNIKEVANDAVIILERFSALQQEHTAPKHDVLNCLRSFICLCKKEADLYDYGREIESLKGRVIEIKNRQDEYGITNILATLKIQQRKMSVLLRTTAIDNQVDVIGFEDDSRTLLAEIVGEDPSLKVISIHGMGGWERLHLPEYNIGDVLKKLVKSFMGHNLDLLKMDEVDLLQHLRKLLDRDTYLAVIDDIWDIEAWEMIKKAFPDKNNGSRIIITTRNKNVAQRVDDRCLVHELRFLREDEIWKLF